MVPVNATSSSKWLVAAIWERFFVAPLLPPAADPEDGANLPEAAGDAREGAVDAHDPLLAKARAVVDLGASPALHVFLSLHIFTYPYMYFQ